MLLFQEEVHKQALLPLDLVTDVGGDVRDHPIHKDAQEHHQVLGEPEGGGERRGWAGGLHCPGAGGLGSGEGTGPRPGEGEQGASGFLWLLGQLAGDLSQQASLSLGVPG